MMINLPAIAQGLASLKRRVLLTVARAVLRRVDDQPRRQLLQLEVLAGELRDKVERFQNYGLTAHPHPGAEAVVLAVGGQRRHALAIAVEDRRYRLTGLAQGEVAIHDDQGQRVHLTRSGIVLETKQTDGVTIKAPKVTVNADQVAVNAGAVDLGGAGGQAVARIGDEVAVGAGSSAGRWPIVSGSGKVKAT